MLYGKINNQNQIIVPNINKIVRLQTNNEQNIVNPITKYFLEKLLLDFRKGTMTGRINTDDSVIFPMIVKSAGEDIYKKYENYISNLFDSFLKNFKITKQIDELVSFQDFIHEFIKFCTLLGDGPFTFTSYVMSRYNSIRSTGLMVTLFQQKETGTPNIELDINYQIYVNTVVNNGFLIDENNRGTIILNLGHESVINKLKESGINNSSDFYSSYFTESINLDINLLSYVLLKKYNEFCAKFPTATQKRVCSGNSFTNESKRRNPINYSVLYTKYNYLYWLKIYLFLRGIETYKIWSQNEFDHYVFELTNIYNSSIDRQYQSGLQYVSNLIGKYPYPQNTSTINFYYEPRL
jgi:hypothetical protein